jgi:outer membrane protein OmpA-like peptidoglycan-associated protein
VDQVYRDQLAKSATSATPPPAQPDTQAPILRPPPGALTHTARGLPPGATNTPSFTAAPPAAEAIADLGGDGESSVIQFGARSTRLSDADRRRIAGIAATAQRMRGLIRVVGHADTSGDGGDSAQALKLSLDRAGAVAAELTRLGVRSDTIIATGVGASEPIVIAGSAAGEAANRRVEIFVDN